MGDMVHLVAAGKKKTVIRGRPKSLIKSIIRKYFSTAAKIPVLKFQKKPAAYWCHIASKCHVITHRIISS